MASSHIPGPLGGHPGFLWRTPGPLGHNDAGDPHVDRIHTTDTEGPLGFGDWADPKHPAYRARGRLAGDWGWDTKKRRPPSGEEMKSHPRVLSCLRACLAWSYDDEGNATGEQGGWIYSSPASPDSYHFEITKVRFKMAVNLDHPPNLSDQKLWVVGTFHTHPHRTEIGRRPSKPGDKGIGGNKEADTEVQQRYGVPGLMINYLEEIYVFGPASRILDWGGGHGFPGRPFR